MSSPNNRHNRGRYPNARSRFGTPPGFIGKAKPIIDLHGVRVNWAQYWTIVKRELARLGYGLATARMYHRVLCAFGGFAEKHYWEDSLPGRITVDIVRDFLHSLTDRNASWSWISSNISVLRTILDKFGGLKVTSDFVTPKRPKRLPHVLSPNEAERLIASAPTLRDQLLLGLMYGCGLKVGETVTLRWRDVLWEHGSVRIEYARGTKVRTVPIPDKFRDLLSAGLERCAADDYIFPGKRIGEPLSPRMAHIVLARALAAVRINKPVTCMTLRHSFAVTALADGMNIRQLQQILGHASIETTIIYERCTPPSNIPNPLSAVAQALAPQCREPSATGSSLPPAPTGSAGILPAASVPPTHSFPFHLDTTSTTAQFHGLLKLHIRNRFLATRYATTRPRPEPTAEAVWDALCADLARAGPT